MTVGGYGARKVAIAADEWRIDFSDGGSFSETRSKGWWVGRGDKTFPNFGQMQQVSKSYIGKTGYYWTGMRDAAGNALKREDMRRTGPPEGSSFPVGFYSLAEAVTHAESKGAPVGRWKKIKGRAGATYWFPERFDTPGAKWEFGTPCSHRQFRSSSYVGGECPFLALTDDSDGFCKTHAGSRDRRAAKSAERQASIDASVEAGIRNEQSERAAVEMLDEISDMLAQLGLRPDTFSASKDGISGPAESVRELVRRAAVAVKAEQAGVDLNDFG